MTSGYFYLNSLSAVRGAIAQEMPNDAAGVMKCIIYSDCGKIWSKKGSAFFEGKDKREWGKSHLVGFPR